MELAIKAKLRKPPVEPRFLNQSDVNLRLDGGIGLFNDMPVVIYSAPHEIPKIETSVRVHQLGDNDDGDLLDANDPRLFTKALEVGYMNTFQNVDYDPDHNSWTKKRVAYFIVRGTNRKQKSVIHASNTYAQACGKTSLHAVNNLLFTGDFRDMLLNEYPKTRDFSFLATGESLALSRNFAVLRQAKVMKLFFNGNEIGVRNPSEESFSLSPGYDHSIMVMRLADISIPV